MISNDERRELMTKLKRTEHIINRKQKGPLEKEIFLFLGLLPQLPMVQLILRCFNS